jgi:hypothetical protein
VETFVLPALLVLMSAGLRSFIVNKNSTPAVIYDIALGLPVDLTYVALSIAIATTSELTPFWAANRPILFVGVLTIAVMQLGAIYKPCKEYIDEDKPWKSFSLWFLNAAITFFVFSYFVLKVAK